MTQTLRTAIKADGTPALTLWQNIYEPTAFIVGKADDLSFFEYGALMDAVFGPNADPRSFADGSKFAAFREAAQTLAPPQVNSMWLCTWEDTEPVALAMMASSPYIWLVAYVFGQV